MKIKKIRNTLIFKKIALVIGLRCVQGMLWVRLILKQIQIAKELFIMDIEQGSEAFISKMLT